MYHTLFDAERNSNTKGMPLPPPFMERQQVKRMMEIGVFMGSSIRMWRDYFASATITALPGFPASHL